MPQPIDPVDLTIALIRCPSVTPCEGGAIVLLDNLLSEAGFICTRVDRGGIANLFARFGAGSERTFGFNGHIDVVPVGDRSAWSVDPFGGEVRNGCVWGRGAADMKSGVAAFVAAAVDYTRIKPGGSVALTITGDEEALAEDGTIAIFDWMEKNGEHMDACLVGEPTCPEALGDMIKIGRRGSITFDFEVIGKQGHSAYPDESINPVAAIARLVDRAASENLDNGSENFQPSTLAATNIDTGNSAANVIPGRCTATVNIRFNDLHSGESLKEWISGHCQRIEGEFGVRAKVSTRYRSESFLTPPGPLSDLVSDAVEAELGCRPELSTSGGTSDARFVKDHCPVVEFGLVGKTIHQVNEHVPQDDIHRLKSIYLRILHGYFS